ncbi:MAG: nucleotidyltransferase family protein, partial [Acidimicrobiales bacterium]
ARPLDVAGTTILALGATDLLLHVCVHGSRPRDESHLQWVADAVTVARTGGIDWDRLVRQARSRRVTLPVRETLAYLSQRWAVDVPPDVLAAPGRTTVTWRDRLVYRARSGPPGRSPLPSSTA